MTASQGGVCIGDPAGFAGYYGVQGDLTVAKFGGKLSGYLLVVAIHVASPQLSDIMAIIGKLFQGLLNTLLTNRARHLKQHSDPLSGNALPHIVLPIHGTGFQIIELGLDLFEHLPNIEHMLTGAVRFIVDILGGVFLGRTFVDLKATLFEHVGPPLPIGLRKCVTREVKLPEVGARQLVLPIKHARAGQLVIEALWDLAWTSQ